MVTKRRFDMKKIAFLLILLSPVLGRAQNYSIGWYKIAGGGGTSAGGNYSLSGTIGQPDASATMTGGSYSLTGGFWSLISVVQTAGLPNLSIAFVGHQLVVSWPDTGAYTLQQNSDISTSANWAASGYTVNTASGVSSVTITAPAGKLFFRLSKP